MSATSEDRAHKLLVGACRCLPCGTQVCSVAFEPQVLQGISLCPLVARLGFSASPDQSIRSPDGGLCLRPH